MYGVNKNSHQNFSQIYHQLSAFSINVIINLITNLYLKKIDSIKDNGKWKIFHCPFWKWTMENQILGFLNTSKPIER